MNKSPTVYYDKELIIKRKDWDSSAARSTTPASFLVVDVYKST